MLVSGIRNMWHSYSLCLGFYGGGQRCCGNMCQLFGAEYAHYAEITLAFFCVGVNACGQSIIDLGWKDTILIRPGETVRIAIDFSNAFTGDQIYLFHCHNLLENCERNPQNMGKQMYRLCDRATLSGSYSRLPLGTLQLRFTAYRSLSAV
jgi:hypothetical protein